MNMYKMYSKIAFSHSPQYKEALVQKLKFMNMKL